MKRFLSILMSISMMFMLVVPASASQATIVVETVAETVVPGQVVTLMVSVENNPGFTNFDWKVNYDENFLSLVEFPEADINLPRSFSFDSNISEAKVSSASSAAYTEDGALFSIKFTVKDDAVDGDTDVSIVVAENGAVANDGTPVEFVYATSTISVDGIDDIPLPIVILTNELHPSNIPSPILVIPSCNTTELIPLHSLNAYSPIVVTAFGIVNSVNPLFANVYEPIEFTFFISIDVIPLAPLNAYDPIVSTSSPILIVVNCDIIEYHGCVPSV